MAVGKVVDRKHLVWAACDELAKQGIKPSVSAIKRAGLPLRGSDPDVQRDVNDWFEGVLRAHTNKHEVAGIPQTLTTLLAGVVEAIREEARRELDLDRQAMEEKIAAAVDMSVAADVRTAEALARARDLAGELAVANESIAGRDETVRRLEEALTAMRTTGAAIEERHAGQLQARDERIAALTADFARKEADYAARIAELDGVRKHALRQIDDARSESRHWKSEFDRVDAENKLTVVTYRQKASSLEADLAGARGRLGAVEESLAAFRQRCIQLEGELAAAHGRDTAAVAVSRRVGAGKVRGAALIKRR